MDNSKSLLTINYKLDSAESFIGTIASDQYYFFVSNHIDANNDVRPFDNQEDTLVTSYQGMIFGKKITPDDASIMIRRIDWAANTIYDTYDHRDPDLYDKDFYVITHEGSSWNVFKCLENGNGNPSTVAPSIENVGINGDDFFYPTDGYRWKYMYSVSDANQDKFATTGYFPVSTDPTTKSQAVPGSISAVQVVTPGRGYNNYFNGSFGIADVRLNGDPKKYGISTPGINTTNGFYDGCWLYVSSGAGAGQYRLIDSYISNSTYNYITLTEEFDSADLPQNGSVFELMPSVAIVGDSREVLPATARAIIDPQSNTVSRVEMIDLGQGYFHATGEVQASPVVGVTAQAGVVPIVSPVNGHGFDAPVELGGKFAGVTVKLIGTEGNTILTDNDYSQIGILRNPLFREVDISLKNQNKDFFVNETVYKINTAQLAGTVKTTLNANSVLTANLAVSGVNGHSIIGVGNTVMINYSTFYQLANVVAVSNTVITLDTPAIFDSANNSANIHIAWIGGSGIADGFGGGQVSLTNATSTFQSNDTIIGATTGTFAQANVVTISGVAKTFDTFMQTYDYIGTVNEGTFIDDEIIYQNDISLANARFHSIEPDANTGTSIIYTTNQWSLFNTSADDGAISNQIKGLTSGAIASLTNKYLPDLVYGSGDVVYIEYGDAITRAAEKTETFKLVFAF